MPQHVGIHVERQSSFDASATHHDQKGIGRKGLVALVREYEIA
jgi:hypothetical protein